MAKDAKNKAFERLKWTDYEKLSPRKKDAYNKQEREANFEAKMNRKYGNSVERGTRKLNKFFS